MTDNLPAKAPLRGGGTVLAIIPQDIDQVWRMAGMAVAGQMAPRSLVDKKTPEEAQAACAIAIMAGAELGLSPLMALRSYAVINGRPSLWGDGIKAVVRQSGLCEFIRTGSDSTKGWCEAKRKDNGETKRVEFTMAQAKAAKLDQKEGPWKQGYADVMMERRATNRCLNDLFADVLGGIASAEEAIEDGPIVGEARDVTQTRQIERPTPPMPPTDDDDDQQQDGAENEGAVDFDFDAYMAGVESALAKATTADEVEEAFDKLDVQPELSAIEDDGAALAEAFRIKAVHLARVGDQ